MLHYLHPKKIEAKVTVHKLQVLKIHGNYQDNYRVPSLASGLNGYMFTNCKSLNVALFILMANHFVSRITLQLLGVKIIPCRVASLIDIHF